MGGQFEAAAKWYRAAADKGNPKAASALAGLYMNGLIPGGFSEALKWYRLAAAKNDPSGQLGLGIMYGAGWGVPQSWAEALIWYKKAAQNGDVVAAESVGMIYLNGLGVPSDFEMARPWLHQAVAGGNTSPLPLLCDPFRSGFAGAEMRKNLVAMDRAIAATDQFCRDLLKLENEKRSALAQRLEGQVHPVVPR